MSPNPVSPDQIKAICEQEWLADQSDCSGFVKAVAVQLGVLNGPADDIVDEIQNSPWEVLADGRAAAEKTPQPGMFVVGGLKGSDEQQPSQHGHVVVVVAGPLGARHLSHRILGQTRFEWAEGNHGKLGLAGRRPEPGDLRRPQGLILKVDRWLGGFCRCPIGSAFESG